MNDKVALITGASSGIGWATAEAFAARGAKVVLVARREKELAELTRSIQERGGQASFVVADVAVAKDVDKAGAERRSGSWRPGDGGRAFCRSVLIPRICFHGLLRGL